MRKNRLYAALMCSAAAGQLCFANPAFAQASPAGPPATSADEASIGGLQEIVVTARLRSENLQDVPAAITALTPAQIESAHISSIAELGSSMPNVTIESLPTAGGSIKASIRGISFGDNRLTFEPVVGLVIDDLFYGTSAGSNIDPFDIESVQVLRGPQGTLFGRNTVAGAIVVSRTRPTGELGGNLSLRYGSHSLFEQKLVVNLPSFANISTKFYVNNGSQKSFMRHPGDVRRKLSDTLYYGASILFEPSSDFDAQLSYDHSKLVWNPETLNMTPEDGFLFCDTFTQAAYANTPFAENGCRSISNDQSLANDFRTNPQPFPHQSRTRSDAVTFRMSWRPGGGDTEVKSITGLLDVAQFDGGNLIADSGIPTGPGGTLVSLSDYGQATDFRQFSQEFRVNTKLTDRLDVVAGVYYFHSRFDSGPTVLFNGELGNQATRGATVNRRTFGQTLNSYAAYLDGTWDITDALHLSLGGRYTIDEKHYDTDIMIGATEPGGTLVADGKKSWARLTGRAALTYDFSPDVNIYASWSRGFRSGGFNSRANNAIQVKIPYDPETVDSFELGMRAELFDRRLRFNPTIFHTIYSNRQETVFVPDGFGFFANVIDNTGEQKFTGAEVEAVGQITDNFTVTASGGYTDARITKLLTFDPVTGNLIDISDQRQVVFAPKYTWAVNADYTLPLGGDDSLDLQAAYSYRGWVYTDPTIPADANKQTRSPQQLNWIPAVRSADFSVTYNHALAGDRTLALTVYVKDAFDKRVARLASQQSIAGTFAYGTLVPTRQWGAELKVKF